MMSFAQMSPALRKEYFGEMAKMVSGIMPPDGRFLLLIVDSKGIVESTGNWKIEGIPKALRDFADQLEKENVRPGNDVPEGGGEQVEGKVDEKTT